MTEITHFYLGASYRALHQYPGGDATQELITTVEWGELDNTKCCAYRIDYMSPTQSGLRQLNVDRSFQISHSQSDCLRCPLGRSKKFTSPVYTSPDATTTPATLLPKKKKESKTRNPIPSCTVQPSRPSEWMFASSHYNTIKSNYPTNNALIMSDVYLLCRQVLRCHSVISEDYSTSATERGISYSSGDILMTTQHR